MGQTRAAAQRKLGFTARLYYMGFGFVALLWFVFYSLPSLFALKDAITTRDTFLDLDGRIALQAVFLNLAGLCTAWFVLTGTKYSIITVPRFLPKLEGFALLFLILFYVCRIDPLDITNMDFPVLLLSLFWY